MSSGDKALKVIDGSWHMPATKRNPKTEYLKKHIPDAVFFGIDECCDTTASFDHMLPTAAQFSDYVGKLGINNDSDVVVYDNNSQFGIFSAQRVWWTFRVFGHQSVSVLDGGLNRWIAEGYETTEKLPDIKAQKYVVSKFEGKLVKDFEEIQKNFEDQEFLVVDARAAGRFDGTAPEPREGNLAMVQVWV